MENSKLIAERLFNSLIVKMIKIMLDRLIKIITISIFNSNWW